MSWEVVRREPRGLVLTMITSLDQVAAQAVSVSVRVVSCHADWRVGKYTRRMGKPESTSLMNR